MGALPVLGPFAPGNPSRSRALGIDGFPVDSLVRVNGDYPFSMMIKKVIAYNKRLFVMEDGPMKIPENEKPREKEPGIPEGIGNPRIHPVISIRRGIIGNHGGAFLDVIIVDDIRLWISGIGMAFCFRILSVGLIVRRRLNRSPNRFKLIPVFFGDGFIPVGVSHDPDLIDIFINERIGRIAAG